MFLTAGISGPRRQRQVWASCRGQVPVHHAVKRWALEGVMIRCPAGHLFNRPIESLTWERTDQHDPGTAASAPGARHASSAGAHDGRAGTGMSVIHDPSQPGHVACQRDGL
jgi:hypothetical protein